MTTPAQIRHVFAKDVRESRWSLLLYVGIVIAVTLPAIRNSVSPFFLGIVVVTGIVNVARVTMSDSPTQPDAFWASRPLRPLAVLGAKLLMAFVILGLPLVGQWIGLVRYDVGGQQLAMLMGKTAWMYASLLLIGMIVGAFPRDMPSLMMSAAVIFFIGARKGPISLELSARLEQIVAAAGVFGSVLLLAHVFRKRDTRLRLRAAAVAASVLIVVSLAARSPSDLSAAAEAPPSLPRAGLRLELNLSQVVERNRIELTVIADSLQKNERMLISAHVLVMTLADGSTLRLPIEDGRTTFNPLAVPEEQGITWLGIFTEEVHRVTLIAPVNSEQRSALARGIRSAVIDATIETLGPRVATIPLAAGARFVSHGRVVRVVGYSRASGELTVDLTSETIGRPQITSTPGKAPIAFALVNRERSQAVPLFARSFSSDGRALVLPGIAVLVDSMNLNVLSYTGKLELDENWLRGAQLMILDWESLGTYSAQVEWPEKPRG